MKNRLLLALAATILAACNVVVTTPGTPGISVAVDGLSGRWHGVEESGDSSVDEYLDVGPAGDHNLYPVTVYEKGKKDADYAVILSPARAEHEYWGFARVANYSAGMVLFHLEFTDRGAVLRWPDRDRVAAMLVAGELPFTLKKEEGSDRWKILRIHSSWDGLLKALNTYPEEILNSDGTPFRRGPPSSNESGASETMPGRRTIATH